MTADMGMPRRTTLVILLATGLAVAAGAAVTGLRAISDAPVVEVDVPRSVLVVEDGLVQGRVRDGLPPFALHWDGQPPAAVLVDPAEGSVLAASVFSDESFARNRNAVRLDGAEARIRIDARRWTPGLAPLVLRVEAVPSRARYHLAALAAMVCATALVVLLGVERKAAIVLFIAAGVFAATYPGAPVRIAESSDEANINSFAAALDHPERFTQDKLLSEPSNFTWYAPVYIALIRAFRPLGFHYATANAFLGAMIAVLLFFGLQRLFTTVSGSRAFGFAAALALGLMLDDAMPAGEEWALLSVLPRTLFTALLPWVLQLAIRCAPSSRRWWIAGGAAGLLAHIYPLSAPVLVGAVLVALVAASDEPMKARLSGAALAFVAAVVAMAPYIVVYSLRYANTVDVDPAVAARAREIARLGYAHLDPVIVLRGLLRHRVESLRILLDALAVILLVRQGLNRSTRLFLGLAAGFAIVTFGLPIADAALSAALGRRPYQIEMVRAIRYLDLFLVGALALAMRHWRGSAPRGRQLVAVAAVFAILAFGAGWLTTARAIAGRARLNWRILHSQPDAASSMAQEAIRAVQALRARDERVAGPVGLRQFDVPLAWVWKDVLLLAYAQSRGLIDAADTVARTQTLMSQPITRESLSTMSRILDARLFLLPRAQLDDPLARSEQVLYENPTYAIVRAPEMR